MNYIKLICIICATFVSVEGFAQGKINRPTKKGQHQSSSTTKSPKRNSQQPQQVQEQPIQQVQQPPKPTTGVINGHEWVDLGLPSRLKWATCNVGAYSPSEYGSYYAWGETTTKSVYIGKNCRTYDKYLSNISGNSQYDAARANWGGSWRLPTKAEMEELINKCFWSFTIKNGHNGYDVKGPNGNSIFLPAAGWRYESSAALVGESWHYWTSTPRENHNSYAYSLYRPSHTYKVELWSSSFRYYGYSVRPVSY